MKIIIPGGSGQVGTILARAFHEDGHEVIVLSRNPKKAAWRSIAWDGSSLGEWVSEFNGADVVINLAGRSVNCRYHAKNRKAILESRIQSTQLVGQAINLVNHPPHTWLQASTATIYAHRFEAANDEATGIIGSSKFNIPETWHFSEGVAKAWEQALDEAVVPQTRKIKLRSAMIMSPDRDGVFDTLLRLASFGLGGRIGDGQQYVSWIHDADFVNSIYWLIAHQRITDFVNLASPNPLPYAKFMQLIRQAWGIKFGLPASQWMVEIGTFLMRTESELVLKSRRVVPGKLLADGFTFLQDEWSKAAQDLVTRWRKQ